jgi:hypothetical protein
MDADVKNLELSRLRLNEVRDVVDVRLQHRLGPNVRIDYDLEYADPDARGSVLVTGDPEGSRETLRAAKGNRAANDPYYRRVDVYIDDKAFTEHYAQRSRPHTTRTVKKKSIWWGVTVRAGSSATLGASASLINLRLKNLDTGREGDYHVMALGGGLKGVSTGASTSDDYVEFFTDEPTGFADFDRGIVVRLSSLGAGFVFIGYQKSYLSFFGDKMGDGATGLDVSGWSVGAQLQLGGSSAVGPLRPDGGSGPSDLYEEADPDTDVTAYETTDTSSDLDMAFFETGSARLSPRDRTRLRNYVDRATARFVQSLP